MLVIWVGKGGLYHHQYGFPLYTSDRTIVSSIDDFPFFVISIAQYYWILRIREDGDTDTDSKGKSSK
ncbi:unnamed protein product [Lactuca virosa]|uniref:Uncharacterized protein n=1 Tax=Lactuca virosa TaxID=75947 RepID=A0AAU9NQK3_9ASTR|nr:unnamed protein product [Lactuca virosa]